MGVYLPNAKMPIGCFGCWVPKELCGLTINDTLNRRHVDCPLVEVKRHGRLIDENDISYTSVRALDRDIPVALKSEIEKLPTIIEAEG